MVEDCLGVLVGVRHTRQTVVEGLLCVQELRDVSIYLIYHGS